MSFGNFKGALVATLVLSFGASGFAAESAAGPVDRPGATVSRWQDPAVTAALGYRYASTHHKDWIVLELAMSANGAPFGFDRENVWVELPDGRKVPMATQKTLNEAMDYRPLVLQVQVGADPLGGYFRGRTREELIRFFATEGISIVEDHVAVDHRTLRRGYLFFKAPSAAFEPGLYKLRIHAKKVDVALPFELLVEQAKEN